MNLRRRLDALLNLREHELVPVLGACAYFFCLLACNYVLRPVRDEFGIALGDDKLALLFTLTSLTTLLANPLFAWLVAHYPKTRFIPITYRFFAVNLLLFFALIRFLPRTQSEFFAGAFFVWMSVFNLFAVSVFWSFMADVFDLEQGKRLFGLIGVGGTLGAIAGSKLTGDVVGLVGAPGMLLVAALLLEIAVQCLLRLARWSRRDRASEAVPISTFTGLRLVVKRPYLRTMMVYVMLQTICATVLYFQQAGILRQHSAVPSVRTEVLADINLYVNVLAVTLQLFFSGRIIKTLGIPSTLVILPLIGVVGFGALSLGSSLITLVVMQVLTRACEYTTARPARETLYTVVSHAERYQSKSFIDTFVYRIGDAIGAWADHGLKALGWVLTARAGAAAPIALAWMIVAYVLGRRQEELALRAARSAAPAPDQAPLAAPPTGR